MREAPSATRSPAEAVIEPRPRALPRMRRPWRCELSTAGLITIGKLARRAGCSVELLRHYERIGLLRPSGRSASRYQLYSPSDARRLRFVRRARELGFSLAEVASLLRQVDEPDPPCEATRGIVEARRAGIRAAIASLQEIESHIGRLGRHCEGCSRQACGLAAELCGGGNGLNSL